MPVRDPTDPTATYQIPTPELWEATADQTSKELRKTLLRIVSLHRRRNANPALLNVIGLAALAEAGAFIAASANPGAPPISEPLAMAHLRGALRGSDGPIHDDGRPYTL
jgi:hypothetical protein